MVYPIIEETATDLYERANKIPHPGRLELQSGQMNIPIVDACLFPPLGGAGTGAPQLLCEDGSGRLLEQLEEDPLQHIDRPLPPRHDVGDAPFLERRQQFRIEHVGGLQDSQL